MDSPINNFANRLLAGMSIGDQSILAPGLERVWVKLQETIEEPNEPIKAIYFPGAGVISVVAINTSGERLEVGIIGPEGMTGLAVLNGDDRTPHRSFVQAPCEAYRLGVDEFRQALVQSTTLRGHLARYTNAFLLQVSYTALANGRYSLEERLARWLLMCHDRTQDNLLPLTHEFLSIMLGVRRAGVTTALHILEGARVIRATRGIIELRDRDKLTEIAGEAYGMPEREYERMFA